MQRPRARADALIAHPRCGYAREKGKSHVKFSNRRQKCIYNEALKNVAAQHFLLLMPYESMKKVIILVENYLL